MRVEQVGPYLWRIPPDAAPGMRVPGLVVADEPLMRQIRTDAALAQLANGATLPGIVRAALAMPDIHQGYGLPVGGVVATDVRSGVVSPGAIGFDINCGVRLMRTGLEAAALTSRLPALVEALYAAVPTGVGGRGSVHLDPTQLGPGMTAGAAVAGAPRQCSERRGRVACLTPWPGGMRELWVCQPSGAGRGGAGAVLARSRHGPRGSRDERRVRRGAQHREGGRAQRGRRHATPAGAPQGGDARVSRPARHRAGRHGAVLVRARRHADGDARDLRLDVPRRRSRDESHGGGG